jgi:hypothetical protein
MTAPKDNAPFVTTWEAVTPAKAKEYLALMRENRGVRIHHVNMLAREMGAGRWRDSPQGIAFDEKGRLYDGQHRLHAIIKSGVTIWMSITRHVSEDVFPVTDTMIPRSFADVLSTMYGVKRAGRVGALVRVLHRLDLYPLREEKPSNEALIVTLGVYEPVIATIMQYVSSKGLPMSVWGALAWAHRLDPAKVEYAMRKLYTGNNCADGDPIMAMRNYFDRHPPAQKEAEVVTQYALSALRAELDGKQITHLQLAPTILDVFKARLFQHAEALAKKQAKADKTPRAVKSASK